MADRDKFSPMPSTPGLSVRQEIEARLIGAREDARARAFEEVIFFLGDAGFVDAAEILRAAAFDGAEEVK